MADLHKLDLQVSENEDGETIFFLDGFELKNIKGYTLGRCWSGAVDCLLVAIQVEPTGLEPMRCWSSTTSTA